MATYQKPFAGETRHSKQESVDEFQTFNSDTMDDIFISHPAGGRRMVELWEPLLVAMAQENGLDSYGDASDANGSVDAIFDEALRGPPTSRKL